MSEYEEYVEEVAQVNRYLLDGYTISNVVEDLSGMHVEFSSLASKVRLLITTASARKYVSTKLFYS